MIRTEISELKSRRQALGLPIVDLAIEIGVREQTLWRWENGQATPHEVMRAAWLRALEKKEKASERHASE